MGVECESCGMMCTWLEACCFECVMFRMLYECWLR
jgi:hypothetical protein